ncbi:LINE-1 retrotransposable element ORF2 protein [Halyomorpha halys]|uniref:LINE-1 retrotransposable element ORF2 protein n=1 Tax=Halyomorpha halys TaxID=286706 RepID=UPI0006D4ECCE|nr:uncharacterized protein LOC106686482 [Halyomorpha halys]
MKNSAVIVLTRENNILDRWREHYTQMFEDPQGQENKRIESRTDKNMEYDGTIWEEEVMQAIEKLKTGRLAGGDGVFLELIEYEDNGIIKVLHGLFQKIYEEKSIPKDWKYNVIVPIHKKGSQSDCNNYRPICLSQVAHKLYRSVLEKRLRCSRKGP